MPRAPARGRRRPGSRGVAAAALIATLVWASHPTRADAPPRLPPALAHALAPRALGPERVVAWPRRPLLDAARAAIGADLVWAERGTLGRGATVCIVDTGIDLAHRDFRDASGRTRVRWLLDLDAPARGVHPALEREGGAVWAAEELDAALAAGESVAPDWNGHGTSVASGAVGDDAYEGELAPGLRAGVAPESALVVVRALRRGMLGLADDDLARAARFCVEPRVSDPARTVVLLALGGHDGPHDGTSPLERALSAVASAGAAVVVAAGNDADRGVHAAGRLVRDEPVRLRLRVPPPERADALLSVVVRGSREVRVTLPGDAAGGWVAAGHAEDDGALLVDSRAPPASYVVWRGALRGGELLIEARGAATSGRAADAWLVDARLGATIFDARFEGESAIAGEEVTVPATADGVISVGASVSRDFLEGESGPGLALEADEVGRARFSSRGPRTDGAPIPLVLAPGGWIVAALSSALDPADPEGFLGGSVGRFESQRREADRIAVAGTSIASALVAGAIALARGSDAPRAPRDEASLLATSASPPIAGELSLAPFDARTGSGQLDLPRYLALRDAAPVSADLSSLEGACTRARVVPGAADVAFVARARGGGVGAYDVVLRGAAGTTRLARGRLVEGWGVSPLVLPALAPGSELVLEATEGGVVRARCRLEVVLDEAQSVPVRIGGSGGCSATSRRAGWLPTLVLTAAISLALGARRRRSRAVR